MVPIFCLKSSYFYIKIFSNCTKNLRWENNQKKVINVDELQFVVHNFFLKIVYGLKFVFEVLTFEIQNIQMTSDRNRIKLKL
jgi:hypothetical protein